MTEPFKEWLIHLTILATALKAGLSYKAFHTEALTRDLYSDTLTNSHNKIVFYESKNCSHALNAFT